MKCAYCGKETKGTKEHIISCSILDLFPECYVTFDRARKVTYEADPVIKDVCADCNNNRISYIDSYAKKIISQYFTKKYTENDIVEIEYDYVMIQKMLLKYAFNDMRSRKEECSFFDQEIIDYLMNKCNNIPKKNVTILCGLAINVSPIPDAMCGNNKIRWCKGPIFFSDSVLKINHENKMYIDKNTKKQEFSDLKISYLFRFNSVQFLLMCWDRKSKKIEENNIVLQQLYPYYLMRENEEKAIIPQCTDDINYHVCEHIHIRWDNFFRLNAIRRYSRPDLYRKKELYEKGWMEMENKLKNDHPR